jgi:dsRNA-specific ribonuclease
MSANVIQVSQLPEIEDSDLLLEVFTHKGIKPYLPGKPCDNERLAELGAQVLSEVVTSHFFKKSPSIRKEEIEVSVAAS